MSARPARFDSAEPANDTVDEWPMLDDPQVLLVLAVVIVATIGACAWLFPPMGWALEFAS
jgi:hypothetical protein